MLDRIKGVSKTKRNKNEVERKRIRAGEKATAKAQKQLVPDMSVRQVDV